MKITLNGQKDLVRMVEKMLVRNPEVCGGGYFLELESTTFRFRKAWDEASSPTAEASPHMRPKTSRKRGCSQTS